MSLIILITNATIEKAMSGVDSFLVKNHFKEGNINITLPIFERF
jgi:hypothetical protein